MEKNKLLKLDGFWIKIIGIISMTFDHIGVAINNYLPYSCPDFVLACRYIGRLALPIFCFLIVEGVLHTRSYKNYALKLGGMAFIILVAFILIWYVPSFINFKSIVTNGNIFIDLLFGSIAVYALKNKNNYIKLIALIPIGLSILSFLAKTQPNLSWYPAYLYMQYDIISISLIIGFYFSYILTDIYFEYRSQYSGISLDIIKETSSYRVANNLFASLIVIVISIIFYLFKYMGTKYLYWDPNIQIASIASILVLLFYNSKRGYDKKWFRITSYLYYPIHIIIIFVITYLVYKGGMK